MSRGRVITFLLALLKHVSGEQCSKLQDLLGTGRIHAAYSDAKTNDICILDRMSCCNREVEQELLRRTKLNLDNMTYLVINEFQKKLDQDRSRKQKLLINMIQRLDTSDSNKVKISEKINQYINGDINSISSDDLLTNDWITTMLTRCKVTSPSTNANLRYFEGVILMLRGYNMMLNLISTITRTELTEECYTAAVRSGLKKGTNEKIPIAGCELCGDATSFGNPCQGLCKNVITGCLKSHILSQKLITYFAANQVILNNVVMSLNQEIDDTISSYEGKCRRAQMAREVFNDTTYITKLGYTEENAQLSLDAHWLCTYVFNGLSKVNCWNGTHINRYHGRIYEFTKEGQEYNPIVPGNGFEVKDIDDFNDQYNWFEGKVKELKMGNDILLESGAHVANLSSTLIMVLLIIIMCT